jgi:hypothetical protein
MGSAGPAFNLRIGKGRFPYQDVMRPPFDPAQCANSYSIPSARGSQSDISGT